jgi:isopentenyldiphosphate isomerase
MRGRHHLPRIVTANLHRAFSVYLVAEVNHVLYLIFKFAVALWQSFDDDIRSIEYIPTN